MHNNSKATSRALSSVKDEPPVKRSKFNKSTSSSFKPPDTNSALENERNSRRMRRSLGTLGTGLFQAEATAVHYRELRNKTEEMFDKIINVLEEQLQIDKETIGHLQRDLETLVINSQEVRAAWAAAEAELSKLKATMKRRVRDAVADLHQKSVREKQQLKEKISGLQSELKLARFKHQMILPDGQRQKVASKTGEDESKKSGIEPVSWHQEYHRLVKENEDLKSQLGAFKRENNEAAHVDQSSLQGHDQNPDVCAGDDPKTAVENLIKMDHNQDIQISFGTYYILVSNRKYLEIDWEMEYKEARSARGFLCNRCSVYRKSPDDMKNHVWCKHYGGAFSCAYCEHFRKNYTCKNSLRRHITSKHPSVLVD